MRHSKNSQSSQYNHIEPFLGQRSPVFGPSRSPEFQALLEALHTCQESLGLFRASVHLQGKRMEDSGCFYKLRPWLLYTHNHSMLFLRLWWLYEYYYYYSKMITRTMILASIGTNRINSCQTINSTIEITGSLHSMSVSEDQQKSSVTSRFWTWYLPIHTKLPSSCSARNSCSRHRWGLQLQSPHSPILGQVNLSSWVAERWPGKGLIVTLFSVWLG